MHALSYFIYPAVLCGPSCQLNLVVVVVEMCTLEFVTIPFTHPPSEVFFVNCSYNELIVTLAGLEELIYLSVERSTGRHYTFGINSSSTIQVRLLKPTDDELSVTARPMRGRQESLNKVRG